MWALVSKVLNVGLDVTLHVEPHLFMCGVDTDGTIIDRDAYEDDDADYDVNDHL